jgi:selenide,water dikinase
VRDLLAAGMVAGGTQRNHAFVSDSVDWGDLPLDDQFLLADAQTSGGLLLSVAPERADALVAALHERNTLAAAIVGRTTESRPGRIRVRG